MTTVVKTPTSPVVVEEKTNPAATPEVAQRERARRVPMSQIRRRLEVDPKLFPGYHLHWFREENVPAAQEAYYELVKSHEVRLNATSMAASAEETGNTDLGGSVSLIAGSNAAGSPVRLYLMKLKEEYFAEDQRALEERNSQIMQAIFGAEAQVGEGGAISQRDPSTYTVNPYSSGKDKRTALYNRPKRKAVVGKRAT